MNDGGIGLGLELGLDHEAMAAPPAVVDADQLNEAIRGILMDADLEQLSRRMVRKQLEAQFQTDLSHYKDKINESILRLIEEQQQGEGEEEEEEDEPEPSDAEEDDEEDDEEEERPKPRKRAKAGAVKKKPAPKKRARRSGGNDEDGKAAGGFNMQLSLSPELASVVGAERMARPQIVKALWAYIREHELQDPNNKKTILFDDTLRRVFQRDSVTMFSMNKFVKRHVRKPEDLPANGWSDIHRDGVSSDEDEAGKAAKKKAAAKRKKKPSSGGDDGDGEKKKRANPFNTELAVSPELASVVGSDRMARPQIVKALWAYIHEHELQDPKDKRSIILDDTLRRVFQRKKFTMFSMNKYIKRHARKPQDLPAGGWDDVPRDGVSSDEDADDDKGRAKKAKR